MVRDSDAVKGKFSTALPFQRAWLGAKATGFYVRSGAERNYYCVSSDRLPIALSPCLLMWRNAKWLMEKNQGKTRAATVASIRK